MKVMSVKISLKLEIWHIRDIFLAKLGQMHSMMGVRIVETHFDVPGRFLDIQIDVLNSLGQVWPTFFKKVKYLGAHNIMP